MKPKILLCLGRIRTKHLLSPALGIAALALHLTGVPQAQAGSFLTNSPMITPRAQHSATLLYNGKVLVAGGEGAFKEGVDAPHLATGGSYDNATGKLILKTKALDSAELYDPVTGRWTATGSMIHPCMFPKATLLADGRVLLAGFFDAGRTERTPQRTPRSCSIQPRGSGWKPLRSKAVTIVNV